MDQFIFNTMIDVTLGDLETTKQGVGETFSKYMTRWKGMASRMVNWLNENDQTNKIIKNLLPTYNSRLLSSPISSFGELCDCGTRIEDAINNGQLEKGESKPPIKKTFGGGMTTSKAPNPVNVSVIIPQQTLAYPSRRATPLVSTPGSVLGPSNPSFSLMTNSCHNLLSLASLPLMSISP